MYLSPIKCILGHTPNTLQQKPVQDADPGVHIQGATERLCKMDAVDIQYLLPRRLVPVHSYGRLVRVDLRFVGEKN